MSEQRLLRNVGKGPLSGVCAGLAAYFSIDPMFVYLVVIGLTLLGLFFLPIVYLVLWLLLPLEGREEVEIGDRAQIALGEMQSKIRSIIDGIMDKVSQLGLNN